MGIVPNMGRREPIEDRFRKRLLSERKRRDWSQAHLAKLLSDKGLPVHATTIAKIEAGDRAVRIEEAVAIADLWDVSLDALLGRNLDTKRDLTFTIQALLESARHAYSQVAASEASLRELTDEIASFEFDEREAIVVAGHEACSALVKAAEAVGKVFWSPGGTVRDASMDALFNELINRISAEGEPGEAQS
jgi:transcriptional regulator with XRE-family HTH domain